MYHDESFKELTFEAWMTHALYDTEAGYYSRQIRGVGPRGDFSTSATLNNLLAEAIAGWLISHLKREKAPRVIIEVGGGTGALSKGIREAMGFWCRLKWRLDWIMVDTSEPLIEIQKQTLKGYGTRWTSNMSDALEMAGGSAIIVHHELVDAFPVRRFQWRELEQQWFEVGVQVREGKVVAETLEPVSMEDSGLSTAMEPSRWVSVPLRDGQRIEVAQSYRKWLKGWADRWEKGVMLTFDYGDEFPALYDRRPLGSLRAYYHHQRLERSEIYWNPGKQDITADVNFSDLKIWGEKLGWENVAFGTQLEFLKHFISDLERRTAEDPSMAFVSDPFGAGEAFKYLIQQR